MAMNCTLLAAGFIELSIGSLVLALAMMLKREPIAVFPLNRERLFLFPDGAVNMLSGFLLVLAGIKPSRLLIKVNLNFDLVPTLFNVASIVLMAKNMPYDSGSYSPKADDTVNRILSTVIGISVLATLLCTYTLCYGLSILPPSDSEDSPVPKPVSSTTTDPLCPTATGPSEA